MTELIKAMAFDMKIPPYDGEDHDSYTYRIIFSALGRWCLETARKKGGITKNEQSHILNNLIEKYLVIFPRIRNMLIQEKKVPICVFIRRVYEETGFLITDRTNHNSLASYQRGVQIGSKRLLFSLNKQFSIEGLGVFSNESQYTVPWREVLIRDYLSYQDYVSASFDITLFSPRDIESSSLQYFNPMSNAAPSASWIDTMTTDKTIARNQSREVYYRVMRYRNDLLFYEDISKYSNDRLGLTDFEYRRLFYALKKFYGFPSKVKIHNLDDNYSQISLSGYLPNREYYLLLLYSWPFNSYLDKLEFIMKKDYLCFTREIFENLGIDVIGD